MENYTELYKGQLENTGHAMLELAGELHKGSEGISDKSKALLKLAMSDYLEGLMNECRMFYLTGSKQDAYADLDQIHQIIGDTI